MKRPNPITQRPSLAARFLEQLPGLTDEIKPLRTDRLGRLVFDDGSHVSTNMLGQKIVGRYSVDEWVAQEVPAWNLGRRDRLAYRKMREKFLKSTAIYPRRICRKYCEGWHSVPRW